MKLKAMDGVRGVVYDLDTGRRVPKVIELDTERGYVRAYFVVVQDDVHPEREEVRKNAVGDYEWYEAYGRFRFVPAEVKMPKVVLGAPKCMRCSSPLTLPGDDLCPRCRAADRFQRNRFVVERLTTPLFDRRCEDCSVTASWAVSDEVEVTPEVADRLLWDRGMTVGRRYYCDTHYRPARLLDPKGEVVKDFSYAGPDTLTKEQS